MKRPRQHEIDDQAQIILRATLPVAWVSGKHDKDYAKDYYVEVAEGGALTGEAFFVQLKGSERLRAVSKGAEVALQLESKYIHYYSAKVQLPVFLVVVDVTTKAAYWLFMQQYVDEVLSSADPEWLRRKKATIHVPTANRLEDHERLCSAVKAALGYMRKKYPGKVEDAIAEAKRRLERLDPRLSVQVEVVDGTVRHVINAKEAFDFRLQLAGDKDLVQAKHKEIVEKGSLVDLTSVSASFSGTPALEGQQVVQVQFQHSTPMEVRVSLLGDDGSEILRLDPVYGKAIGGTVERRFVGTLGSSPLNVHITVTLPHEGETRTKVGGTLSFDLRRWAGQPIRRLQFFDQVSQLAQHLANGGVLRWTVSVEGNEVFVMKGKLPVDDVVREVRRHCEILRIARDVSCWSGIEASACANMSAEEVDQLLKLSSLLDPANRTEPYANKRIELEIPRETVRELLASPKPYFGGRGTVRIVSDLPPMMFLGQQIQILGFVGDVSEVEIEQTNSEMQEWLDSTVDALAKVRAHSTPSAIMTKTIGSVRSLAGTGAST